ncbi:MAG TPA: CidA/LrgA family protein [Aquabacterium sp.]|nr:CidA/LrgA family protein [Aquabacterium sp.]
MIQGMAMLVAGQLMGEALVSVTGLPVPGSVAGMVLVLLALLYKKGHLPELRRAGSTMLLLVPLLLVPVSVGIMEQAEVLKASWWPLTVALLVSIVAGMVATGLTIRWLRGLDGKQGRDV